jgi:hypothetical protein
MDAFLCKPACHTACCGGGRGDDTIGPLTPRVEGEAGVITLMEPPGVKQRKEDPASPKPRGDLSAVMSPERAPAPKVDLPELPEGWTRWEVEVPRGQGKQIGMELRPMKFAAPYLLVGELLAAGAVMLSNKRQPAKAIEPGDHIVAINGAKEPKAMFEKFIAKGNVLFHITVERPPPGSVESPGMKTRRRPVGRAVTSPGSKGGFLLSRSRSRS